MGKNKKGKKGAYALSGAPRSEPSSTLSSSRHLKRKSSDTSDRCKLRPIEILQSQFAIKGRCLGQPQWVSVKFFDQVAYTPVTTRSTKWLHQMLSSVKLASDYQNAIKLTLSALSQGIDKARLVDGAKTVDKVSAMQESGPPPETQVVELDASVPPPDKSDDEASSGEGKSGGGSELDLSDSGDDIADTVKSTRRAAVASRASTKTVSVDVFGYNIDTTTKKAPLMIKLELECVRNFIKAVKKVSGMHETPAIVQDIQPLALPRSTTEPNCEHPVNEPNVYYNWRQSCFSIRFWSNEADKYKFTNKTLRVLDAANSFGAAKLRVCVEAKKLWNELDESDRPRFAF
jgi:hypothetical protein